MSKRPYPPCAARRFASIGLVALALALLVPDATLSAAPAASGSSAKVPTGAAAVQDDRPPADPAQFARCLGRLESTARSRGISDATWAAQLGGIEPDRGVLASLDFQPEFRTPIWDYLAALVDTDRIEDGRAMLAEHATTLAAVERRFGVDPATVVAVWGVESNYGRNFGKLSLVRSLATLSCFGRRQSYFQEEFLTLLRIAQEGHVEPGQLVGSWAGAFGQTQFMPSTFMSTAIDFDGDGRRDIVGSVPDALASTANFLRRAGWRRGESWGFEVGLPDDFNTSVTGRRSKRPLSEWISRGVTLPDGQAIDPAALKLSAQTRAGLIVPAQRDVRSALAPAFLVLPNFDAIYSYNAAESYALAIAHLADRLRGGPAFHADWPTDDPGIGRAERRELQKLLIERGHDIGEVDGLIGSRSRAAIAAEEERLGWPRSGRAGRRILEALRR
ncbi:MAG: lytic murein transglycosylase [Burkholderiaceae bacterium]|jgi:lytic murein transglycosylase|nr:lytic murein transglycosylase [Burkholderiaceae bacterium]MEB2319446.1 lytic murein transglycosylase [Pseudomonadota bacterium]